MIRYAADIGRIDKISKRLHWATASSPASRTPLRLCA